MIHVNGGRDLVGNAQTAGNAFAELVADFAFKLNGGSHIYISLRVSFMVYPRYDLMIGDVRATQNELETTFNEAQEGMACFIFSIPLSE